MRKVLTALFMLFALPASAAECVTVTIDDLTITDVQADTENVRVGLVGTFLWVQTGPYIGQDELEGTTSFDVGDATGASVCEDGTVTFTYAEIEPVALTVDPPAVEAPEEVAAAPEIDYALFGGLGRYAFDA